MAGTLYIHSGTHKTGTTSIQASLNGYEDEKLKYADLGAQNHSVPIRRAFNVIENMQGPVFADQNGSQGAFLKQRQAFRNRLTDQLSTTEKNVIISGEGIARLNAYELRDLENLCRPFVREFKVIIFLREPRGFATSMFQQRLKAMNARVTLNEDMYRWRITQFLKVFGSENVIFREFGETTLEGRSSIDAFCAIVGASAKKINGQNLNASMLHLTGKFLFSICNIHALRPRSPQLRAAWSAFIDDLNQSLLALGESKKFTLPSEIADQLYSHADWEWAKANSGLLLQPQDCSQVNQIPQDLTEYMLDWGGDEVSQLKDALQSMGVAAGLSVENLADKTVETFLPKGKSCSNP